MKKSIEKYKRGKTEKINENPQQDTSTNTSESLSIRDMQ